MLKRYRAWVRKEYRKDYLSPFDQKYGLDRGDAQDMEEDQVTQRLRLIGPKTASKPPMNH